MKTNCFSAHYLAANSSGSLLIWLLRIPERFYYYVLDKAPLNDGAERTCWIRADNL